jgi:oligosaccharyltransferase complex subunit beta
MPCTDGGLLLHQGNFSTKFKVPDVYGVFKFVIEYTEPGYNHIELSKQIAVSHWHYCEPVWHCCAVDSRRGAGEEPDAALVLRCPECEFDYGSNAPAQVRPFKHDEFDRFLVPAYPYYTAAATTMLGFALLTVVFLYSS